jgi:hypothetical protein
MIWSLFDMYTGKLTKKHILYLRRAFGWIRETGKINEFILEGNFEYFHRPFMDEDPSHT